MPDKNETFHHAAAKRATRLAERAETLDEKAAFLARAVYHYELADFAKERDAKPNHDSGSG